MPIEWAAEGAVAVVRLGRPDSLHAVDLASLTELADDLRTAVRPGVRGIVLAGSERAFCAGADLNVVEAALAGDPRAALDPILDALEPIVLGLRGMPVPTAAALEGPAVGVGMSLALATDLRTAGRSAVLVPGFLRIGATPDGGFTAHLGRAVGPTRALSLLIRNQRLGAVDLQSLGLAEVVVDDGAAIEAAVDLVAGLPPVAPLALTRTRALLESAFRLPLEEQLGRERDAVTELWDTADYLEGIRAFFEKRPPRYVGA